MGEAFTTKQIEALLAALSDAALVVDESSMDVAENGGAIELFGLTSAGEPVNQVLRAPAIQTALATTFHCIRCNP